MAEYEPVHTVTSYWDGPRAGVAEFRGRHHFYEAEWDAGADEFARQPETFLLTPVAADVVALALEDWAIWLRWETAYHLGQTSVDTHPALPADRGRHAELAAALAGKLVTDSRRAIRATARFRVRSDPAWSGYGAKPHEALWTSFAGAGLSSSA